MKKNQNLPNTKNQSNNSAGKPLPDSYNNYNHLIEENFAEDPRTEETHKIVYKTDKVDQIFRKT